MTALRVFSLAAEIPLALALGVALFPALPVAAQQVISAKSGLLAYGEGDVKLNDQPVEFSNTRFEDVKENSVVSTADGRVEVLLTPGVTLRMGENSSLRMITNRLVDTRLELLSGSAVVEADLIAKDTNVTMVVGQASVEFTKAGLYRLDVTPSQIKVFKGDALVEMGGQSKIVSSAHMLSLASDSASIQRFDTEDTDPLDRWSHRRGSYLAMANTSAARSLVSSGAVLPSTWGMVGCSSAWGYNSYYSMMTFIPCSGSLWSPYGYQFWSPYAVGRASWMNAPIIYGGGSSRTVGSTSGSALLARPVTTASYRSTSSAPALSARTGTGTASVPNNAAVASSVNNASSVSAASSGMRSSGVGMSGGGMSGGGMSGGGGSHASAGGGGHK
jgi:hypothetical protein